MLGNFQSLDVKSKTPAIITVTSKTHSTINRSFLVQGLGGSFRLRLFWGLRSLNFGGIGGVSTNSSGSSYSSFLPNSCMGYLRLLSHISGLTLLEGLSPAIKLVIPATSCLPIASRASLVAEAICGVKTTCSIPINSGLTSGSCS